MFRSEAEAEHLAGPLPWCTVTLLLFTTYTEHLILSKNITDNFYNMSEGVDVAMSMNLVFSSQLCSY